MFSTYCNFRSSFENTNSNPQERPGRGQLQWHRRLCQVRACPPCSRTELCFFDFGSFFPFVCPPRSVAAPSCSLPSRTHTLGGVAPILLGPCCCCCDTPFQRKDAQTPEEGVPPRSLQLASPWLFLLQETLDSGGAFRLPEGCGLPGTGHCPSLWHRPRRILHWHRGAGPQVL